jgi:hypothetical protein
MSDDRFAANDGAERIRKRMNRIGVIALICRTDLKLINADPNPISVKMPWGMQQQYTQFKFCRVA